MHHLKRQRHGCILATWRIHKLTGPRLELHIHEQGDAVRQFDA